MKERWKPIDGYDGKYYISDCGRVYSTSKNDFVPQSKIDKKHRYHDVKLYKDGVNKHYLVHRLVAESFVPKVDGCNEVNHIDNNQTNNHYTNLEWCTHKDNMNHAFQFTSNVRNYRPCYLYDKDGSMVGEFCSLTEASKKGAKLGACYSSLMRYHSSKGFKIVLVEDVTTISQESTPEDKLLVEVPTALAG